MASTLNIQLSTTGSIVGHELIRHIGPVSAQFVIGTGLFTDVFSSFTDFFGAGSRSYEKKLSKVERQGLDMVRARAAQVGANAVIGLRIDHDEISGAGKSMLMVTLAGTAVVTRKVTSEDGDQPEGRLTADLLRTEVAVRAFIAKHADDSRGFPDTDWDFVLEHTRLDLAPLVLTRAAAAFATHVGPQTRDTTLARATAFFASLPTEEAQTFLYGRLGNDSNKGRAAAALLARAELADLGLHLDSLKSDDPIRASNAIRSVTAHPPLYQPEDVEQLRRLATQLRDGFPVTATLNEKSGIFSNETWTCAHCETENGLTLQHCASCNRDRRGLFVGNVKFANLAATLDERADALAARLAS